MITNNQVVKLLTGGEILIDTNSNKLIYIQIAEAIETEILVGNLKSNEQAPSTNQFASLYQINPATARKGLNLLVDEGILYKKRGLGMFVVEDARKKILIKRQDTFFKDTLPEVLKEAKRLEISNEKISNYIKTMKGGED